MTLPTKQTTPQIAALRLDKASLDDDAKTIAAQIECAQSERLDEAASLCIERRSATPPLSVKWDSKEGSVARLMWGDDGALGGANEAAAGAALGSGDTAFIAEQVSALALSTEQTFKGDAQALKSAVAIVRAAEPRNELEGAMAVQIAATHALAMKMLARVNQAQSVGQSDAWVNQATKLQRTMTALVEGLGKLRTGGKQSVEVRYVYVNGNAMFGDAYTGAGTGGWGGNPSQPHFPCLEGPQGVPLHGPLAQGYAVPTADHARQEALQVPRGKKPRRPARSRKREL